ncbi:MAG: HD-GYP domain-containing protein [Sporomusaceae bacterium]|nr:HD-GYP domain-containing protein [Sporomusaceae bacterium]
MRRIAIEDIEPGMYLARPLIASDGTVLLHEGIEMKERYIRFLQEQGISELYMEDGATKDIIVEDVIDPMLRQKAMQAASEIVDHFQVGKGVSLDKVKMIVETMIDQLGQNPANMIHFIDLRRKQDYLFSHAVNTCILSVMTGISLGYEPKQLEELGLAAMLHDIGKLRFPYRLALQYPGSLSEEEKEEYRQHPFYALEILRENTALPMEVANACFQHHERWDGSGYPMGLIGEAISEYAQIISIADVYDRLVSGTPNRRPMPVYYAVAILNKAAGTYFNPMLIDSFTENIAVYPIGTTVRLSNNQVGVILNVDKTSKTTPIVRIMSGEDSTKVNQLLELDLKKHPELFILDFL